MELEIMSNKTTTEYTQAVQKSKDIFLKKMGCIIGKPKTSQRHNNGTLKYLKNPKN